MYTTGGVVVGRDSEVSLKSENWSLEPETEVFTALHFSIVQSSSHLLASLTHAGVM